MTWEVLFIVSIFAFSALAGWIYLPQIVLIAKKRKLFDVIDARKSHKGAIPRIGGLSFFPIFLLSITLFSCIRYALGYPILNVSETSVFLDLQCLAAGLTLMYIVGLADDLSGVSYKTKFAIQILAALTVVVGGFWINNLQGILGIFEIPWFIGMPLTILVAVFVMNAYNLIDGIDGLCSGLSAFTLGLMGLWFTFNQLLFYGMMAFAILGVLSVFFFMNVFGTKNKVFMGDTGSLTLGFIIVFLGFKFYWFSTNTDVISFMNPLASILGITFVPLFDTVRVFGLRISKGLSPFYPDKNHIHHKFLLMGFGHRSSSMYIIILQAFYCIINTILQPLNINLIILIDISIAVAGYLLMDYIIKLKGKALK
ncbi:MAG: undecaprenyl/decaprenyl-phosphate alpha-N-acetylglucosaminyl 1-phosphate transferase [Bacteroidales bacterium]|nr:undecaprenyl/decaprenyl-phosphate alpha-N-acetylglucosaminyl 1-phosphate transferase [Bacteroidales bacterium]MBQ8644890.1 undecaprenyl/decaprenyl-phosphate alpha-N-acetylglucosaminyl 1-phosphate transferase [Bacteroidales bacterium]